MGNLIQAISKSKVSKRLRKLNRRRQQKSEQTRADDFIVKYMHMQKYRNRMLEPKHPSVRRTVFVSLIGLYQTWTQCPYHVLYAAMFILPLKRKWLYEPATYIKEIEHELNLLTELNTFNDTAQLEQFIELLKWKDSQGLVFWALDDYEMEDSHPFIHPFWTHFNAKLVTLYDPVTRAPYKPIQFDEKWWQHRPDTQAQFGTNHVKIFVELCILTLKYASMKAIIHQSNPSSFDIVTSFSCTDIEDDVTETLRSDVFDGIDASEKNDWWISREYDPYDLE